MKYIMIFIIIGLIIFTPMNFSENSISIIGSSSVQPVCEELVEEYKKTHKNIDINVQGGGSSLGIKCANSSMADIGMSSCEVDNITAYEIGRESIVLIVNPKNPINTLSKNQIKDIFSGKITDWSEISSKSGKINVIIREQGSGTLDAFEKIMMNNSDIKKDAIVQNSAGAVKQSVTGDENAIGFVSLTHLDNTTKDIKIDGIKASPDSIKTGKYILQRPFLFVTNSTPDNETMEFINWTQSENATEILSKEKIIKVD